MKAVILAAGYATRLYPLTLNRAKPLLEVANKKIIDYVIDSIKNTGLEKIYVVTNNKFFNSFAEWRESISNSEIKNKVIVENDGTLTNDDRLGAVGDIDFVVKKHKIDDDLIVLGGDNIFDIDLRDMIRYFNEKRASVILAYDLKDRNRLKNRYGCIVTDKEGRITDFEEKPAEPKSSITSTCIYIFSRKDVKEISAFLKSGEKKDNTGDFIRYLSHKKDVFAYIFDGVWFDIGSKDQYEKANELFSNTNKNKPDNNDPEAAGNSYE